LIFKDLENLSYVPPLHEYKSDDDIEYGTACHLFQQKIAGRKDAVQIPLIFFSDGRVVDKAGIICNAENPEAGNQKHVGLYVVFYHPTAPTMDFEDIKFLH